MPTICSGAPHAVSHPRICWISPTSAAEASDFLDELRRGLREAGYAEGRNVVIEPYWGENSPARIQKLIAEIVASSPQVIVAQGATAPFVRRATTTIPVVFGYSGDPVEAGLVESLSRPGGNMTGISYLVLELVGKRIELLKELLPGMKRLAVVAVPQHPGDQAERRASERAAKALGLTLEFFESGGGIQVVEVLAAIERARPDAVMMFPVQSVINNREAIAAWAIRHRLPVISGWAQFADGGNLMSYGPNLREASRRLAYFVDKVLKGARPADLPVELPTRVELVVNRRAAKAIGIAIPQSILVRADRVVE